MVWKGLSRLPALCQYVWYEFATHSTQPLFTDFSNYTFWQQKLWFKFTFSAKTAAMTCPFLSRLPSQFVKNYSSKLLKTYGEHCPVVSHVSKKIRSLQRNLQQQRLSMMTLTETNTSSCRAPARRWPPLDLFQGTQLCARKARLR